MSKACWNLVGAGLDCLLFLPGGGGSRGQMGTDSADLDAAEKGKHKIDVSSLCTVEDIHLARLSSMQEACRAFREISTPAEEFER